MRAVTRYESSVFGPEYQDNLFACQFNMQKVTRHVLDAERRDASRRKDSDFLVSSNRDFHPTDVLEDADGSLLVIDTGGWYKLCCPTSQLAKPDVLGGIYRISAAAPSAARPPRPHARLDVDDVHQAGAAARRRRGRRFSSGRSSSSASRGAAPSSVLSDARESRVSIATRRNAVWALTRIDERAGARGDQAGAGRCGRDRAAGGLHSVALWRDAGALATSCARQLKSPQPAVQRVAAEAIGRIGDAAAVPDLLAASASRN